LRAAVVKLRVRHSAGQLAPPTMGHGPHSAPLQSQQMYRAPLMYHTPSTPATLRILVLHPCAVALSPQRGHLTSTRPGQKRCGANSTTEPWRRWNSSGCSALGGVPAPRFSVGLRSGMMKSGRPAGHSALRLPPALGLIPGISALISLTWSATTLLTAAPPRGGAAPPAAAMACCCCAACCGRGARRCAVRVAAPRRPPPQ
jgi:hypothetical protein